MKKPKPETRVTNETRNPQLNAQNVTTVRCRLARAAFCLLLSAFGIQPSAFSQTTAFTYQGQLDDGANPASGTYDLRFALYDADLAGSPQGGAITNWATPVSNGLFTVTLDFGNQFPGADRWLEIGVRTNGGGAFSWLAPRQPLTATPYAITAGNVTGLVPAGQVSGALSVGQLPVVVLTNMQPNVSLTGTFAGDGAGLTNLNAWQLGGNVGTTPGTHFLGTTDNQPVEVRVNGQRALRVEPNAGGGPNVIGGAPVNFIAAGVVGATISGGGATNAFGQSFTNRVTANLATVGGGADNAATDIFATVGGGRANNASGIAALVSGGWYNTASGASAMVGGGQNNMAGGYAATIPGGDHNTASGQNSTASGSYSTASGQAATVGGGFQNTASGLAATVSGGSDNQATNNYAAIGGGYGNQAWGQYATVPGGFFNQAAGATSFAAGRRAKALHNGTFNWADAQDADFYSTTTNQFNVRAAGGARFETGGAGLTVDGQPVLAGANGGTLTNLNASQLTGGTVPPAALSNTWKIGGNSGTTPTANFLGTTDNQPLEIKVNGVRALRVEPAGGTVNLIGGYSGNVISNGVVGGFIGGGGDSGYPNRVGANYASVLGGFGNVASGESSAAMGFLTTASSDFSTAMGFQTTAGGQASTAMGLATKANANVSAAMGYFAQANHEGSFVWADSTSMTPFASSAANQFLIRASGGVGINTTNPAGAALAVNGTVTAASFSGNGAGLTGINAATLGGISAAQFIRNDITNSQNVTFAANTQVQLGGGAASVPSLTFASDLDTGLFPGFGGGLGFTVDGLERMRVHPNGLGIGTVNPQGPLHIYSANNPSVLRLQSSAQPGFGRLEFVSNPQGDANEWRPGYIQSTDAGSFTGGLAFYVNGTGAGSKFGSNEVMRLQNGCVGIGTTNPQSLLHVQGTARVNGADQWDVNNTEGDLRVGSDTHRFKIGVSQGGGGAGDVWMRAQGGTARLFLKTPGGTTIYSNETQTNGVTLAAGGGSWTSVSDRHAKENFEPVDAQVVLAKVAALPLTRWNYKSQDAGIRHLGPMAQDFKAAFGLGESDTGITTVDADGVALAAIQGLNQKLEQKETEIAELKTRLEKLEQLLTEKLDGGGK